MPTAIDIAPRLPARWPVIVTGYVAAYVLLDRVIHTQPLALLGIAPWDPPAGLSLALLLSYGLRFVPAVALATIVGEHITRELEVSLAYTILASLIMTAGYSGTAAVLRKAVRIDARLRTLRDLTWFCGVTLATELAVAVAFVSLSGVAGLVRGGDWARVVLQFWIGDITGIMVMTPFLLVHGRRFAQGFRRWRPTRETLLQGASVVLVLWIVFGLEFTDDFKFFYLLFLPLIWIAMRHGIEGTTMAVLGIQIGLVAATLQRGEAVGTLQELQLLMLTLAMTGLFLGMVVTERRGALGALNDRESELNRMLRIAGAGEMASALAHELNQPLSAITAYLRACRAMLLSPREGREGEIAETMDKAVQESARAAEVVRRLRDYFGTGTVRLEPCALAELVLSAVEPLAGRLYRHGISLDVDCPSHLPRILADRLQLEMVLHNLVGNAIDAMDASAPARREIRVSAAADEAGMLHIRVEDSGPGVAPEMRERLFHPFATGKPQGMGLGLVISRSIVEAHRGKLWYEPAAGGAAFIVTLPTHAAPGTAGA